MDTGEKGPAGNNDPPGRPGGTARSSSAHPWSLPLGSVAGIPIRIHPTFWLLPIGVAYLARVNGDPIGTQLALVAGLFGCVLLHELGHSLMAKLFKIRTRDITLYPIGGVSNLESMGTPAEELLISLTGPSVNVFLAIVFAMLLLARGEPLAPPNLANAHPSFLQWMLAGNLILAFFNIIPAFPMDGGRILRAGLALFMDRGRATQIAARVGQVLAVTMGISAIYKGWIIVIFIAVLVFLGAGAEAEAQKTAASTSGYHMRDAMITRFETISHGDSLGEVVERLLRTNQEDFPVLHGERVLGVLTRRQLLAAISSVGREAIVAGVMTRDYPFAAPDDDLSQALDLLKTRGAVPILIMEGETLAGMITLDNLVEFLSVARAGAVPTLRSSGRTSA